MIDETIREVLAAHGNLCVAITDDTDLYGAGLTSHASVNVMLGLENAFDVEFPDRMLRRSVFESLGAIQAALRELTAAA